MMSLTSDNNNEVLTQTLEMEEEVLQECVHCHQQFVAKYWDSELDWYIEVNSSTHCRDCSSLN